VRMGGSDEARVRGRGGGGGGGGGYRSTVQHMRM
jgi:hypothetical protein